MKKELGQRRVVPRAAPRPLAVLRTADLLARTGLRAGPERARALAFAAAVQAVAEHGAAAEPQPPGALRASDLIERLYRR